jgi:hypothetical protein
MRNETKVPANFFAALVLLSSEMSYNDQQPIESSGSH